MIKPFGSNKFSRTLFLLLSFLFFFSASSQAQVLVDRIVAIVNSEIILESDFKELLKKASQPGLIDESLLYPSSLAELKKDRQSQLNYLISEKLLDSEVKRLNLSVTAERVQQEIKDMGKRNNMSPQDVLRALKEQGVSSTDYQFFLKTKIERQSLAESEIISKLRITEEDALAEYLKKNPQSQASVNEYSLAHIFFNPKKDGGAAALERANRVLSLLRSGEKFETLAEKHSEDPNFSAGGFLGTFKSGEFLKELEESVRNLAPQSVAGPVKSKSGFHIVKLLNKKITTDAGFEKAKGRIISELMESSFRRQLKIWLQSKRNESFVRINTPSNK